MKIIALIILILFLFSGCVSKPDEISQDQIQILNPELEQVKQLSSDQHRVATLEPKQTNEKVSINEISHPPKFPEDQQ